MTARFPGHTPAEDPIQRIHVVIADDHLGFRQALQRLIDAEPDITVVAAASDGAEAFDAIVQCAPDVAVLDVRMPGRDGIDVADAIAKCQLSVPTVIMTMHWDLGLFERAAAAGARGYLAKETALSDVRDAIRAAHRGDTYVAPILSAVFPRH